MAGVAALLALQLAAAQSWTPPSGGAVEMFRQGQRTFTVGARSGGAGGSGAPPGGELIPTERTLRFELVPVQHWDSPGSPAGHGVDEGRVLLYLRGESSPRLVAAAEEAIALPPGTWYVVGEAPGWVTTFSPAIEIRLGDRGDGDLVLPLMRACQVRLTDDPAWRVVDRVDLVSITEAAVYPLAPGERQEAWIPAGSYLAYSVVGGEVLGISPVDRCGPGDRRALAPPVPPSTADQGLIVEVTAPPGGSAARHRVTVAALPASTGGEAVASSPAVASLWQGDRGFFFFPRLTAGAVELTVTWADGTTRTELLPPAEGTVREQSLH